MDNIYCDATTEYRKEKINTNKIKITIKNIIKMFKTLSQKRGEKGAV